MSSHSSPVKDGAIALVDYAICTTARSGSNLICDYLKNTRLLGAPIEALNPDAIRQSKFFLGLKDESGTVSLGAYLEWLRRITRSPNGVFGIKLLFEDFDTLRGLPALAGLLRNSRVIHLRRRAKLRQAISYYFAEMTGQWVARDRALMPLADVPFDYQAIERHLRRLTDQEARWASVLEGLGVESTELYFEDFLADPAAAVRGLLGVIGVPSAPESLTIHATLPEQKNPKLPEFVARFREQFEAQLFGSSDAREYKRMRLGP